jgi:hypothetical protein
MIRNKNSILPTYRPALRNINLAPESMTAVLQTSGQRLTGVYRHGGRFDIPSFTADNDLGPCFRSALTLAPRSGIARRPRRGEPLDMASVQSWAWDYPGHHAKIDGWQTLSTNLLISRLTSLRGQIT